MGKKNKILVLTPTFTGGSWVVIEELLDQIKNESEIICFGLGPSRVTSGYKVIRFPYFLFENLKNTYGSNIFFNFLYQLPLFLLSPLLYLWYRPAVTLSNGFTPILSVMFLGKIFNTKNIIYFGSVVEGKIKNPAIKILFKALNFFINSAIVNSVGGKKDLGLILEKNKIIIVEHWTNLTPIPVNTKNYLQKKLGIDQKTIVLFVGKLSADKHADLLIRIIHEIGDDPNLEFWFIGAGELKEEVEKLASRMKNVKYIGYIKDKAKLREYYSIVNITFGYADKTYLARPAIESLACGTPIIIPDKPAVLERMTNGHINKDLVPGEIGWLVSPVDLSKTVSLLKRHSTKEVLKRMRVAAQKYAKKHYSSKNIQPAFSAILD